MQKQKGFSLIELLIVVAIILIIAAIAIPNLMRARMSANDSSAAGSIRSINTAEIAYRDTYPVIGFPPDLPTLGGPSPCTPATSSGCLIDSLLASATSGGSGKSGYFFSAAGSASTGLPYNDLFFDTGSPISAQTGTRSYCSLEDAVIRLQASGVTTQVSSRATCQTLSPMSN
jgi:type IV pilus assembly protein PilA